MDNPSHHHTRQFTLELMGPLLAAITGIFVLCTLVNLLFKILVFRLIYKKGPLMENPVNVLILVDEVEKFANCLLVQPQIVMIFYEPHIELKYGEAGCAFLHLYVLSVAFSAMSFRFSRTSLFFFFLLVFIIHRPSFVDHSAVFWPG